MSKIVVIAFNTFKEAIRNRILYIILIFAILLLLSAGVIGDLSISNPQDVIRSIGLSAINMFSILIAIFVGIGLVYNEIDKRTIYTIVSKPIDRTHFLLGKYFGLLLTIYVNILIMTVFFFFTIYYQDSIEPQKVAEYFRNYANEHGVEQIPYYVNIMFYVQNLGMALVKSIGTMAGAYQSELTQYLPTALLMNCFELAIITAFAVLFSSFSTPTLSAILTFLTFLIGRGNEDIIRYAWRLESQMAEMGANVDIATTVKYWLTYFICHISPNLSLFNLTSDAIYGDGLNVFWTDILYGFVYTAAILTLAAMIFKRRNFK